VRRVHAAAQATPPAEPQAVPLALVELCYHLQLGGLTECRWAARAGLTLELQPATALHGERIMVASPTQTRYVPMTQVRFYDEA
jgi:hypothetical protein